MAHRSDWSEQDRIHFIFEFIFEQDLGNLGRPFVLLAGPEHRIDPIKLK
jgi:hypothetical protein